MGVLDERKVLYFLQGEQPTPEDLECISRIRGHVQVRSAVRHSAFYVGENLEPCDAVACIASAGQPVLGDGTWDPTFPIPEAYADEYDWITTFLGTPGLDDDPPLWVHEIIAQPFPVVIRVGDTANVIAIGLYEDEAGNVRGSNLGVAPTVTWHTDQPTRVQLTPAGGVCQVTGLAVGAVSVTCQAAYPDGTFKDTRFQASFVVT